MARITQIGIVLNPNHAASLVWVCRGNRHGRTRLYIGNPADQISPSTTQRIGRAMLQEVSRGARHVQTTNSDGCPMFLMERD